VLRAAALRRSGAVLAVVLGCLVFAASAPAPVIVQVPLAWTLGDSGTPPTIATPYPSTAFVSGTEGTVTKATVTLNNLFHSNFQDLQFALVGPSGQALLLANVGTPGAANNLVLTFDDSAASSFNCGGPPPPFPGGTFKTTACSGPAVVFPPPAPAGPYNSMQMNVFNGQSANGAWSLYGVDAVSNGSTGMIQNGWTLTLDGVNFPSAPSNPPTPHGCMRFESSITNAEIQKIPVKGKYIDFLLRDCGNTRIDSASITVQPKKTKKTKKRSAFHAAVPCGVPVPIAPGAFAPVKCKVGKGAKGSVSVSASGCIPIDGPPPICVFPTPLVPITAGFEAPKKKK
jgi:subtilisin-like proprotein convertase family protein